MTDREIREIADEVVKALNNLAPNSAEWWEKVGALGPVLLFIAALIAAGIAWKNLQEHRRSEARSEWWRRTQWALSATVSENTAMMSYGTQILDELAKSEFADEQDERILEAVWSVTDTGLEEDRVDNFFEALDERDDLSEEEKAEFTIDDSSPLPPEPPSPTPRQGIVAQLLSRRIRALDDSQDERDTQGYDRGSEEAERGN